jgi:CheY-like chemotaxis protein/nitrogen-specific signal transduction histidine kinase
LSAAGNEKNNEKDSEGQLREKIEELTLQNTKLTRELRITREYLGKVTRMVDAKEALGQALTAANARQAAYTQMLLRNCPSIILLLDDTGRLVLGTSLFLALTGTPNFDYLKNQHWEEILSIYLEPGDLEDLRSSMFNAAIQKKQVSLEKWIDFGKFNPAGGENQETSKGNRCYSINLICIGVEQGGGAGISAGILMVFLDLTDFIRERERAEAASRAKSDFLAVMSHEIRTPMNAIMGMGEVLSRTELTETQSKHLADIRKAARSLLMIINDILDFSKIEAGKLEIINTDYNLRSLLDNLYSMFSVLFKGKDLHFIFSIAPDFPDKVHGDENRVRQILTNILSNALKYTPRGEVRFSSSLKPGNPGILRFDVKDSGIGIREEDMDKLFRPFEQLDTRKNRNVVGTGLGLAICYKLCGLMGGRLWVESEYGKGSVFSVEIPCLPAGETTDTETGGADTEDFTAPDAKVLVVDDIEINLEVCSVMLSSFSIESDLAQSGREAVELAEQKNYDLIFMDHMMPEMNGLETTALIRSLGGANETLPIIALTANAINGAEQMFMEHRFNGFLAKPIEFASLGRCLRRFLPPDLIIEK